MIDVLKPGRFWTALPACLLLAACNNAPDSNVVGLSVNAGPANTVNIAFVTVMLCAPGSSTNCQTIDHVQLDTGSTGLRIISGVLSSSLGLPAQTDPSGNPVAECMQFADGFSWGSVKRADLKLGDKIASSIPIQIIGDPAFPTIPTACANTGSPENTVADFGANGLLGIGYFLQDCGADCVSGTANGLYYSCPGATTCTQTALATDRQVAHPVAAFSGDDNGVMIQLPGLSSSGAASAQGTLVFGIGTQMNNGLGPVTILSVDPNSGTLTTTFNAIAFPDSFIDSGSNVYFLPAAVGIPGCTDPQLAGFLCPTAPVTLSASNQGINPASAPANISVTSAATLNGAFTAFNNIAAINSDPASFDFGLPFFFGRTVFVAIETKSTPGGTGPYVAY